MCQDIEVHLIVRTRQWLSQGEGRLQLGGPECCSSISFCLSQESERVCTVLTVSGCRGLSAEPLSGQEAQTPTVACHPWRLQGPRLVPPDLPPEHFSSGRHLLFMDALVPLEKKSEHSSRETESHQELMTSGGMGCGWRAWCKISHGLWMLWCSWEGLSSTSTNVSPVKWELMMLEKILWGKISA